MNKAAEENFAVNPDDTVAEFDDWSDVEWDSQKVYDDEGVFAGVRI